MPAISHDACSAIKTLLEWQNGPLTGRPFDVRDAPVAPSLGYLHKDTPRGFGKCVSEELPAKGSERFSFLKLGG